jgi:hypothetical protein
MFCTHHELLKVCILWGLSNPGPVVPISDGNLLPEIAQVAEGLEFIDGYAVLLGKVKKARVNREDFLLLWPSRKQWST